MGKISNTVNYYFSDNKRFADLFNAVFFQGKTVVEPESLSEGSETYHQPETRKTKTGQFGVRIERIRDVCKKLQTGGVLRILTLEKLERGRQSGNVSHGGKAAVLCAAVPKRPSGTA